MLNTSTDLLLIVLAFCALWLTFFISWMIYYMVMMLKQANEMVSKIKVIVDAIAGVSLLVKAKAEKMAKTVDDVSKKVSMFSKWKYKKKRKKEEEEEEEE